MASAFTHAFFAASLGTVMIPTHVPKRARLAALGALLAVLPDADVIAFAFGIPYADLLGHRGLSHSLAFAAAIGALFALAWGQGAKRHAPKRATLSNSNDPTAPAFLRSFPYLFVAMASHGVLDAMTDGGLGVAFFAPFSSDRYFFGWRPILVSPIAVDRFFSLRGLRILRSEFFVVWLPSLALAAGALAIRHSRKKRGH
jgi:inner membrane protein